MARPGLARHRKFKRLARTIDDVAHGFGEVLARGLLETLWDAAYEAGEPYLGDADDVESLAGWRGTQGLLADALRVAGGEGHAGFTEEGGSPWWPDGSPGTFRIHDLWDHAPDYVRKRRQREQERQARGAALRRTSGADRTATGHGPPNDGQRPPNGRTRSPSPSPSPSPSQEACAETVADAPAPAPAPAIALPCVGTGPRSFEVTHDQVRRWREAFPGTDVDAELRKAEAWLEANPTKRKTAKGMPRFLVAWLGRAQDGAGRNGQPPPGPRPDYTDAAGYEEISLLRGKA